ncbi:MAG TPA: helix-turn-helix domain-containing protein [Acidimicrobiales bacterium]|jgi:DNA-binding HxlR family transcriptional regulator|nr:helix-turn-helix domain-containing protein [Acidimicrobiales bacterium]
MAQARTYSDGCSSAHALDLVGERWALLIIRDLLFGPKRFSDLRTGLPQASANVLSQRLRDLEDAGIIGHRKLPPPASAMVYELTEWGLQLEPILMGLQTWGAHSPSYTQDIPIGCDAAMLALKNFFGRSDRATLDAEIEIRFSTGAYRVRMHDGRLEIHRGSSDQAAAIVETEPTTLEEVAFRMKSLQKAEKEGSLQVDGDRAAVVDFFDAFPVSS